MYSASSIVANTLIVGGSILLFFAPFLLLFFWQNRHSILKNKPGIVQFMDRFFDSKYLNWLVLVWAAAEAVIWFVIPEFLLLLIIFMKVRHKANLLLYDIYGTIVGSVIALSLHFSRDTMLHFPFVYEGMFTRAQEWFTDMGIWGLINQPFSGVPYKVFLAVAPEYGFNIILFLILAIVLRVGRYGFFYIVFWMAYPALHRFVYKHYIVLFIVAIVIFTLLLMRVSSLYS
jgi:hypothetical protein